jgi:small conductance mechanosensitive channel
MAPRCATFVRFAKLTWYRCFLPLFIGSAVTFLSAQQLSPQSLAPQHAPAEAAPDVPEAPTKVEVQPAARDAEIEERLRKILEATGWFRKVQASVQEGVVFLDGFAETEEHQRWAAELARNTEGVVAVVNRMQIETPPPWDFTPAREEIDALVRGLIGSLPLIVVAVVVLAFAWAAARLTGYGVRRFLRRRLTSRLLREVAARAAGTLVLLLGFYFVLRIWGLTRLAVTLIGGTGLVGLVLGIAFRDITENFLASLYLSLQQPFREGDLVEITGTTGFVQRLTSRTTVLMTLDGNQVQVPNATVFKSTLRNFSSNPNRREDFVVGIGYDVLIPHAQEVALAVLAEHPAVLKDPEPWVLVDSLGASSVTLRVYFWLDGSRHSWLKVRSSVIRLVKRALQDAEISLPDEAREVIFPDGVPVRMLDGAGERAATGRRPPATTSAEPEAVSTRAEAELQSEAEQIKEQARGAWSPEQGENLLCNEQDVPSPDANR